MRTEAKEIALGVLYTIVVAALVGAAACLAILRAAELGSRDGALAHVQTAGYAYAAEIAVGTSAVELAPLSEGRHYTDYECCNNSATVVTVGDSSVTSGEGGDFCNDSACGKACWGGPLRKEYAITASGTVDVNCRWKLSRDPASFGGAFDEDFDTGFDQ